MKVTSFNDLPQAKMGFEGEKHVIEELKQLGFFIFKCTDALDSDARSEYNKAPKIHGADVTYIFPDILAFRDSKSYLIEIKTKTEPTLFRKTQQLQHGINLRHYNDYLNVLKITNYDLWLAIYERSSHEILLRRLIDLPIDHYANMYQCGRYIDMVYFNRNEFAPFWWFLDITTKYPGDIIISNDAGICWKASKTYTQQTLVF